MNGSIVNRRLLWIALILLTLSANAEAGWTKRDVSVPRPLNMPPSWEWHPYPLTLVYDSHRHVTVGIGGHSGTGGPYDPSLYYLAVSEYNGNSWVSRYDGSAANTPTFREIGNAVFDSKRNVTIIFGGWVGSTEHALNELWEYDGTTWTQRTWTGPGPAPSEDVPMAFDPIRGRTIFLTLSAAAGTWETWEWTGSAWDRGPDLTGVNDVSLTKMVFDIGLNKAFVYTAAYGDIYEKTYEYTPGATAAQGVWQNVPISGSQYESYYGVSMVYDPYAQRVLRHGGRAYTQIYGYEDATDAWDSGLSRWNLVDHIPEYGRAGAGMCFDLDRVTTVLYGGIRVYVDNTGVGRTTNYTDTWEYTDNSPGGTWVDFLYAGTQNGLPQQPWNTFAEGLIYAPYGGTIYIKSGTSAERLLSSNYRTGPVTVRAWNGPVRIGQ